MPGISGEHEIGAVLAVGGINVDINYRIDHLPAHHEKLLADDCTVGGGGSGANTAFWLARLGVPAFMAGIAGQDIFGDYALGTLAAAGVDVSACLRLPGCSTNLASIFSCGRYKAMVVAGTKYGRADAEALIGRIASLDPGRFAHIHCATHDAFLIESAMRIAREHGLTLSLELDGMYDAGLVARADLVFSNMEELARATGAADPVAFLASAHAADGTAFAITDGSRGAAIICRGGVARVPTTPVEPADRTGGGDAFDAGLIAAWLRGDELEASAARGLALASLVIQERGARPPKEMAVLNRLME